MCVLAMKNMKLYAILFGILAILLLLLAVNDKNWKPLKEKLRWNVTANYSENLALKAVDFNLKTHWSSYAPMASGMFFQVDVGKPVTMNGILLQVARKERKGLPLSWTLKGSLNGEDWFTLEARPGLTYRGMLVMPFKAIRTRYVQIIQTSINATPTPWLISELDILQPVVPWQFSRATLLNVVVGWLLVILAVALYGGRHGSLTLTLSMIAILLTGWFLRTYGLVSPEFSEHESRFFQRLAFGRYTQGEWLSAYWGMFGSRTYWLYLLLIRLAHGLWRTPLAAFRVVAGLFSLSSAIAAFFAWRFFSQSRKGVWEALILSGFLSVAGWQVYLSRNGDFSGSFLLVFLLYLPTSYAFLYKRGSLLSAVGLAGLLCLGIFLHPVMGLAPVAVLLFGGWHLWLCKYAPTFFSSPQVQFFHFRHHLPRIVLYFLSTLPGLIYWVVVLRTRFFHEALSLEDLKLFFRNDFGQILQAGGIKGVMAWLFWGLVLFGLLSILKEREHSEWFMLGQILIVLFLLSPFLFDALYVSAFSLLVFLLLCLCVVRGLLGTMTFLSVRQSQKAVLLVHLSLIAAVLGYTLFSAVSSLFFTSSAAARETGRLAAYREGLNLGPLLQQVLSDPVECHQTVMLEAELAAMYKAQYKLEAAVSTRRNLSRLAKQGMFYFYAFARFDDLERYPDREQFLKDYYTEVGRTSQVVLYRLREEFCCLPQRYYARDLFSSTGRILEDEILRKHAVFAAPPDDRPGLMVFGPFVRICEAGNYIARFRLRLMESAEEPVVTLKVMADRHEVFGAKELSGSDFPDSDTYYSFEIPFHLDFSSNPVYPMKRLELLVDFYGEAEVRVESVELIPEGSE